MKNKYNKQEIMGIIKEIIKSNKLKNQKEICEILKEKGINITQPTISKYLKTIGAVKVNKGNQSFFTIPSETSENLLYKTKIAFKNFVKDILNEENIILIKTTPGSANNVAVLIDELEIEGLLGTVAGDDTIIAISKKEKTDKVIKQLKNFLEL